jgi:hypothetical protein
MTDAAAPPPSLGEAQEWIGARLTEVGGDQVGEVQGFYVDAGGADPVWLIAKLGRRRGTRIVAVPFAECAGRRGAVWTAQPAATLRQAPVVDPIRPLRREHEITICRHFGIGSRVGRAAALARRDDGEVTATPPPAAEL